jgi:hypothetical protein
VAKHAAIGKLELALHGGDGRRIRGEAGSTARNGQLSPSRELSTRASSRSTLRTTLVG